jgi:hypothetical protein
MKKIFMVAILGLAFVSFSVLAQEKKDMPMKECMPMKAEGMEGGGMMMGKMKEMQGKMGEMKKGMGGMMKGQGMMKCEDMKGMGNVSG